MKESLFYMAIIAITAIIIALIFKDTVYHAAMIIVSIILGFYSVIRAIENQNNEKK